MAATNSGKLVKIPTFLRIPDLTASFVRFHGLDPFQDIKIGFLHAFNDRHPVVYLSYLAVVGNCFVNGMAHLLLLSLSRAFTI